MNVFKSKYWIFSSLLLALFLFSDCGKDDESPVDPVVEITEYNDEGFFILNEGPGSTDIGSISYYHRNYGVAVNNIFQEANNGNIVGSGLQHMTIIENKAYIVAQNSNKVVIANPTDMTKLGEITGFQNPKYIAQVGPGKAYVSQWGADGTQGSIQIVDLNTNTITGSIQTRQGPQEMLRIGNNIYVAISGGVNSDSILTKINVLSNEILKTIEVGTVPTYLEVDKDLNLWVLTRGLIINPGDPTQNIRGNLVKIEDDEVTLSLTVKPAASGLTMNRTKDRLYFVQNGWVYEHPITSTSIALIPFIEQYFYGLDVDPKNGNFIGTDAKDLVRNGEIFIFDSDRIPLDTVEVGTTPGRAVFQ